MLVSANAGVARAISALSASFSAASASVDHSVSKQGVEVDDLLPVAAAMEQDWNRSSQLLGLCQRQNLADFVERSEAARERHHRSGKMGEP